jgi:hypothetical protein
VSRSANGEGPACLDARQRNCAFAHNVLRRRVGSLMAPPRPPFPAALVERVVREGYFLSVFRGNTTPSCLASRSILTSLSTTPFVSSK